MATRGERDRINMLGLFPGRTPGARRLTQAGALLCVSHPELSNLLLATLVWTDDMHNNNYVMFHFPVRAHIFKLLLFQY